MKKTNEEIDSMICECGGDFRPDGALFGQAALFEPYYDSVLRTWVHSYSDQEKKAVNHRSSSHPEGLRLVQWDKKYIKELKNIRKNKEDYKQQEYKGQADYKPGSKSRWKDGYGFITSILIVIIVFSSNVSALEGVDYIQLKIKGIEYDVPIPNKETRQIYRELRETIDGDSLSRELLLGERDQRMIFIGDVGINRWVKLTKDDIEVIEH